MYLGWFFFWLSTASTPACRYNRMQENTISVNENQKIEITCRVNYSDNWAPVMKWQQDWDSNITDERVVNNTVPYKSVTYSVTVRATRDMNGSKFFCTTYFSAEIKPASSNATNVSDNNSMWTSTVLSIRCEFSSKNMILNVIYFSGPIHKNIICYKTEYNIRLL